MLSVSAVFDKCFVMGPAFSVSSALASVWSLNASHSALWYQRETGWVCSAYQWAHPEGEFKRHNLTPYPRYLSDSRVAIRSGIEKNSSSVGGGESCRGGVRGCFEPKI